MPTDPDTTLLDTRIKAQMGELLAAVDEMMRGGGSDGGGRSAWQTSVENRLQSLDNRIGGLDGKIDRNFLVTWAGIIAAAVGLAGLMAAGFGWLDFRAPDKQETTVEAPAAPPTAKPDDTNG